VRIAPDDLFKLSGLWTTGDQLGLRKERMFLQSLWNTRQSLKPEELTPFQANAIDMAFRLEDVQQLLDLNKPHKANSSNEQASSQSMGKEVSAGATTPDQKSELEERLTRIWDIADRVGKEGGHISASDLKTMSEHCAALGDHLRKFNASQVFSLSKALAVVHYRDYTFASKLARRGCELASQCSANELIRFYNNMVRLNVQDSLVAVMNRIEEGIDHVRIRDIHLFVQALERQGNTSAVAARVLPKMAQRAAEQLTSSPDDRPPIHRPLLVSLSRYNLQRHPSFELILKDAIRCVNTLDERDLLAILQSIVNTPFASGPVVAPLLQRAEAAVPCMDARHLEVLVDVLSQLDSGDLPKLMLALMSRIVTLAGNMTSQQTVSFLDILSTYPAAAGDPCITSLLLAIALRKDAYDGDQLGSVLVSCARLHHFSDDFYAIADFAVTQRHGIKSQAGLMEFITTVTPQDADFRLKIVLAALIMPHVPSLNDVELNDVKKTLVRLGIDDKQLLQKLSGRYTSARQQAAVKRSRYDPADDLL